jgi:hypothetical protein
MRIASYFSGAADACMMNLRACVRGGPRALKQL